MPVANPSEVITGTGAQTPIEITPTALSELTRISTSGDGEGKALRIGVKNGGCSGLSYILEFDAVTDHDDHYHEGDLEFVIDRRQVFYLAGTRLDFDDGLKARGFEFSNPNAETTCGCGTSFSV